MKMHKLKLDLEPNIRHKLRAMLFRTGIFRNVWVKVRNPVIVKLHWGDPLGHGFNTAPASVVKNEICPRTN